MKKIPSLFKRDYETHKIYTEITEGCEWVLKGEGISTRKFDGTACMIKDDCLYKRFDCKKGREVPIAGIPCQPDPDPETGHWPWWIPVTANDKYHLEAFMRMPKEAFVEHTDKLSGTYELCGPKINGNPENFKHHILIPHGKEVCRWCPTDFVALPHWLADARIEGIVWYHPDGRMCKIKLKDFGIERKGR